MNQDPISQGDGASGATLRLLRAALDMAGDDDRLARRLHISAGQLAHYMSGASQPPRHVMLRLVDLLLLERESGAGGPRVAPSPGGPDAADGVA